MSEEKEQSNTSAPEPAPAKPSAPAEAKKVDDEVLKNYWYPDHSVNGRDLPVSVMPRLRRFIFLGVVVAAIAFAYMKCSSWMSIPALLVCIGVAILAFFLARRTRRPVYLLDFSILHPEEDCKMSKERFDLQSVRSGYFKEEALKFQARLNQRTGLGEETYLPKPFFDEHPGNFTIEQAREEALSTIIGCCDDLFEKTGVKPREIDFVILNCSLFCPTPSLSSMIMNHYKMRDNVKNFNLGGMGCSCGLVSIDLARDLLAIYPNSNVLVFSTENITMNWYPGQVKGMLLSNTLFRVGGAAILLTNKCSLASRAKYQLLTTERVNIAADDEAHHAIYQQTDPDGNRGVKISRELSKCVAKAMTKNLTRIAPRILPPKEIIRYAWDWVMRHVSAKYLEANPKPYMPDFRAAFDHICIHAGGRAIIDGIEETMHLSEEDCMPSRATLYRYGNTSSSSVWYEMNYIEGRGLQKKGDRTFQIAFGSGLKCNTVMWKALHTMPPSEPLPESFTY